MPSTPKERKERALKPAKKTEGGNTNPDREWLAEVEHELHPPDESTRPPGFIYDIHYQWEGYQDELSIEFFESFRRRPKDGSEPRRCNGTGYVRDGSGMYVVDAEWQRLTRPCLAVPAKGGTVCHAHGAKIPAVKAAAERALAEAAEVVALRLVGLTDSRDELNEAIEHKIRLAAANSVLDRVGIKGGSSIEIKATGFENVLGDLFGADSSDGE